MTEQDLLVDCLRHVNEFSGTLNEDIQSSRRRALNE
jgi:hypothetical protein